MSKLLRLLLTCLRREEGASIVEYAVGMLLVAIITIAGIAVLGNAISNFFASAATSV